MAIAKSLAFLFVCALACAGTKSRASAAHWTFNADPSKSQVDFHAIGRPSAIRIHGIGHGVHGTFKVAGSGAEGDLVFPLASLDTGIKMRNEHMKNKYLEVAKFPDAVLSIKSIQLPPAFPSGDYKAVPAVFKGDIKIHGIERPVSGTAEIDKIGNVAHALAHFSVKISDFKIDVPKFMGITVANLVNVDVAVDGSVKPQ